MINLEQEIWEKKKFSDLLREIYKKSNKKEDIIKELINDLSIQIKDPQSATMIVPLLASYLGMGIKNDEQLIKLAAIIQRCLGGGEEEANLLSEEERKQLLGEIQQIKTEIDKEAK